MWINRDVGFQIPTYVDLFYWVCVYERRRTYDSVYETWVWVLDFCLSFLSPKLQRPITFQILLLIYSSVESHPLVLNACMYDNCFRISEYLLRLFFCFNLNYTRDLYSTMKSLLVMFSWVAEFNAGKKIILKTV